MPAGASAGQCGGEILGHPRGEEARMGIGEAVELGVHRLEHVGMGMAKDETAAPPSHVLYFLILLYMFWT